MRIRVLLLACLLGAVIANAQRHKVNINTETPEGQMLQQIGQEEDAAKKLALMEQFATQHPKHEAAVWVYELMVPAYTKAGQFDKAMDAGEKLLALDPADAQGAHEGLKAAEAKKDPDAVKKWAVLTSDAARKVVQSKKGEDEDEEEFKQKVDFAKQVDVYTEYSLYAMALQTTDPAKRAELAETLAGRNPNSQYLPQVVPHLFTAYIQSGQGPKAVALAEKADASGQANEEMLLALAGSYRSEKKAPEKVLAYTAKTIQMISAAQKPQGVSDADWEKRKVVITGRANFIAGATHFAQNKFADADMVLRAALPGIKDDQQMTAEALFYLGVSNYRLGEKGETERIKDALAFSQQCANIAGPFQAPARSNVKAIRSRYRVQ